MRYINQLYLSIYLSTYLSIYLSIYQRSDNIHLIAFYAFGTL